MTHITLSLTLLSTLALSSAIGASDVPRLTQQERSRLFATLSKFAAVSDLHVAVQMNDTVKARKLVMDGADPHAKDTDGRTPMNIAMEMGDEEMIRILATRAQQ